MHRRFVIPWRHERATTHLTGLPVLTRLDLENCVDEKDPLHELHQAVQLLETNYNEIKKEILSVMQDVERSAVLLDKESENLHRGIDWSHIRFTDRGKWNDHVERSFPKTSHVLRQIYPFDACASRDSKKCPSQLFVRSFFFSFCAKLSLSLFPFTPLKLYSHDLNNSNNDITTLQTPGSNL